jgi:hypothetical protein
MGARTLRWSLLFALLAYGCFGSTCSGGGSAGGGGGCGDDEAEAANPCARPYTGASLDGEWELHAKGTRTDCRERRFEGELEIDTTVPLKIAAEAQATFRDAGWPLAGNVSDAFVLRIERADFELSGDDLPRPITFSGVVRGSCVELTLTEQLPDGDSLHYELSGALDAVGRISGNFTGQGPEQCRSEGRFSARIR